MKCENDIVTDYTQARGIVMKRLTSEGTACGRWLCNWHDSHGLGSCECLFRIKQGNHQNCQLGLFISSLQQAKTPPVVQRTVDEGECSESTMLTTACSFSVELFDMAINISSCV